SPDGALLAGAAWGAPGVTLWETSGRRPPDRLVTPGNPRSLAFSSDGAALAAVDQDGDVRIWSTADGRVRRDLRYPVRRRATAAVSLDRRVVASVGPVGAQNAVELWGWE